MDTTYKLGDIVETKKSHPCGSSRWQVIRTGADVKIKCQGCGHIVMMSHEDFVRRIRKVIDTHGSEG